MKPAGMHRQEGPAGQRGSLFKGPDAAGRPAGFIPPGEGWRASPCYVRLVSRSTCYAATRLPCLARPVPLARRRGVLLGALTRLTGFFEAGTLPTPFPPTAVLTTRSRHDPHVPSATLAPHPPFGRHRLRGQQPHPHGGEVARLGLQRPAQ